LTQAGGFQVARADGVVYVRAVGQANMRTAPLLDVFLQETLSQPVQLVCIDLSVCTGMDSTFMGLLVGTSQSLGQRRARLVIVNPSAHNLRVLQMLGVETVVPVIERCLPVDGDFCVLSGPAAVSPAQRLELVHRAHLHLSAVSEANRSAFAPFLSALQADLRRREGRDRADGAAGPPTAGAPS
jgi:anti-sigma B factor antagonist